MNHKISSDTSNIPSLKEIRRRNLAAVQYVKVTNNIFACDGFSAHVKSRFSAGGGRAKSLA